VGQGTSTGWLADQLRLSTLDICGAYPRFLREMFGVQADHRADGGWLGLAGDRF
jgi:hypothetical protein